MDVNLVTVEVSVTDLKSCAIKGLVAKDFEIYEDEKLQKSSFFSAEEQPISLALLLDKNHRMEESGKLEEAKRALLALMEANHADTEISYLTYDRKAIAVQQLRLPVRGHRLGASLAFKQRFGLLLNFLLPRPNLHWMNTVLLPNLVDRLHPSQCLQTHLRLELGCVDLPLLRFTHHFSFLITAHSLNYRLKTGIHYKSLTVCGNDFLVKNWSNCSAIV